MGKQIGGQLQVNLRLADALMAQVRGQHRKFRVEISSFLVPLDQPVNGKRVPNVMKTWTLAPSAM